MTHEFQKTRIDNLFGRKDALRAGREIRDGDVSMIRIFCRTMVVGPLRNNPDVMSRYPWEQSSFRCDGPALDVTLQEIGVFFQVFRRRLIASFAGEARG